MRLSPGSVQSATRGEHCSSVSSIQVPPLLHFDAQKGKHPFGLAGFPAESSSVCGCHFSFIPCCRCCGRAMGAFRASPLLPKRQRLQDECEGSGRNAFSSGEEDTKMSAPSS